MVAVGTALACPQCQKGLEPQVLDVKGTGLCRHCRTPFEFRPFPALHAPPAKVAARVAITDDAVCFFHSSNTADAVCDSCGRFLCTVCTIDFAGKKLCPSCIALAKTTETKAIDSRVLYGGIALSVALVPMIIWPVTIISGPIALGFVITGWRRPGSLVGGSRGRLVIAGLVALIQIAVWLVVLINLLFHPWSKLHFSKH